MFQNRVQSTGRGSCAVTRAQRFPVNNRNEATPFKGAAHSGAGNTDYTPEPYTSERLA